MADDIPSLAQRRLHNAIEADMAESKQFAAELRALLEKWRFPKTYVDEVVPELFEAHMNGDATPIWTWPNYRRP